MTKTPAALERQSATWQPAPTLKATTQVIKSCLDAKGFSITVLDMAGLSDVTDHFVIVSARSDRHVQGIFNRVINDLADQGIEIQSIEGYEQGHWAIIDTGEIVVHVFYEPVRRVYDLEGLWSRAQRYTIERADENGIFQLKAA